MLRVRLVRAGPRRKTDFQTRVARSRAITCSTDLVATDSNLQNLAGLDDLQRVD